MKDPLARLTRVREVRRDARARELFAARAREEEARAALAALEAEMERLDAAMDAASRPAARGARITGADLAAADDLRRRLRLTLIALSERRDAGEEAVGEREAEAGAARGAHRDAQRALERWEGLVDERARRAGVRAEVMSELVEERPARRGRGI